MNLAEKVTSWAQQDSSIRAAVLIGSRVRAKEDLLFRADGDSDWDFQLICDRTEMFETVHWTKSLNVELHTYSVRRAAIGGVPKIAAIFANGEADFVIIPSRRLLLARWLVRFGFHQRSQRLREALQDLAVVVRPGWRFLKGAKSWEGFYQRVVADVGDPRLSDDDVRNLANSFVCDQSWTLKKIRRGENLAAQRMLHRSLVETNFRLLHELKLREGQRSFPEARRSEFFLSSNELCMITVSTTAEEIALRAAVEKSSSTCRALVRALVGENWIWPKTEQIFATDSSSRVDAALVNPRA